jgi:hypothetical protein
MVVVRSSVHGGCPDLEGHVGVRGGSGLKRDGGGARRWQGVRDSRGDEAPLLPLLEAVEALALLPSPRRPHCSNCTAVEALPLLDGGPSRPTRRLEEIRQQHPTASTSTGVGEQGPIWALIFFIFEKMILDVGCE